MKKETAMNVRRMMRLMPRSNWKAASLRSLIRRGVCGFGVTIC